MKQGWQLNRKSEIPLYLQIKHLLKEKIRLGEWSIGTTLPSQRKLAQLLDVNRSTVVEAYEELMAEGLIEGVQGKGTRVVNNTWNVIQSEIDWNSYVIESTYKPSKPLIQKINEAEFSPSIIRLGTGELGKELLPIGAMNDLISNLKIEAHHLGYEEPKGSLELRQAVCKHVQAFGIHTSPSSVLIVSGALQAFQLIASGLLKQRASILAESPSYVFSINAFQSANVQLHNVPIDQIAKNPSILAKLKAQHNASLFYTIPTFHNPTGFLYTEEQRQNIVHACQSSQLPIVEDDVYRELWIDTPPPPTMKSMDQSGNILYIGSLSKLVSPGLRIGWIIGPETVINRLADLKMQVDYGASSLSQAVAERWLSSPDYYNEHVNWVRISLKERRAHFLHLLDTYFSSFATWSVPTGSFYVWVRLQKELSLHRLFDVALKNGILINPGSIYEERDASYLRLSYSYESKERIEQGMKQLASCIQSMIG
ncbi:PLP-dependent aminotransferase family protein [Metabacillus iocasae]|uniref:GntR family transcriptional regulator of abcA and norABC n=1 Tax=Priestia iocasae TaxID=2291674 RepID=A0ABS2QWA7_9BACI|nr:PLP-dependent aminotransferase family protein [Metabacillus iocasae]MBM7703488.1 GntR family transcriptional regulator of abcA and norABC [Metabacillus iocasae]